LIAVIDELRFLNFDFLIFDFLLIFRRYYQLRAAGVVG